jgi:hypothetical protein
MRTMLMMVEAKKISTYGRRDLPVDGIKLEQHAQARLLAQLPMHEPNTLPMVL